MGNRTSLIETVAQKKRPVRRNKASQTKIKLSTKSATGKAKSTKAKPGKAKPAKAKASGKKATKKKR